MVSDESADVAASVPFGAAIGAWSVAWVVGSLVVAPLVITVLGAELGGDLTIPQLTSVAIGSWAVFLAALVIVSRRSGTGDPVADLAVRFRPADLIGVPVGVATQLAVIPLLYVPLRWLWPEAFSADNLEQRARELADRATGWSTVLLVLVVVVGAPIVEELVYRGLLQRSLAARVGAWPALAVASAWFSLIHLSPVEYPGLFAAGLVFGVGLVLTGRIGPSMVMHAAFNATGIVVVLASR